MKNEEKKVNEVEEKSAELTEEELAQVSGGKANPISVEPPPLRRPQLNMILIE